MKKMQKISYYLVVITLGLAVATITLAFTGPPDDPPDGEGYFWRLSGSDLYYPSSGSGKIGIGTTGPDAKLHVIGSVCAEASDTGCTPTSGYVRGAGLCIGTDCRTSWPSGGGGGGTVTSVGSGDGLTGGPITTSGTLDVGAGVGISVAANSVAIDTTSISTCTNGTTAKIIWDGTYNRLTCGTDQGITGSGTSGYVPVWSGTGSVGNSNIQYQVIQAGGNLGIGMAPASGYFLSTFNLNVQYGIQANSISTASTISSGGTITAPKVIAAGNFSGTNSAAVEGSNSSSDSGSGVYGYGNRNGMKASGGYAGVWAIGGNTGVAGEGGTWDFYAQGAGGNYGPFTGAHDTLISADVPKDIKSGSIMSLTGQTRVRYADDGSISLSSTLPTVALSSVANDKKVLGVLVEETSWPDNIWYEPKEGERYGIVNALGEGRVLVTNINGDIQAGDYITTSPVAGYGQKQDDDVIHSYTLGKITENVDWGKVTQTVEFNGKPYKSYLIGVIYVSG